MKIPVPLFEHADFETALIGFYLPRSVASEA